MGDVKEDIGEKFGVSWMGSDYEPSTESQQKGSGPGQVNATQAIVGVRILNVLIDTPEHADTVHHLVDKTGLDISSVLAIVPWLEDNGFVTVESETYGNHLLRLTKTGEALSQ